MQPHPPSPRCFSTHNGFEGHQNWALNLLGCLLPATRLATRKKEPLLVLSTHTYHYSDCGKASYEGS